MRRYGPLIGVLLAFAVTAFALVKVYEKGKDSDRLLDTQIPQETIDWINNLGNNLNDILSWFDPNPDQTPWGNQDDQGRDSTSVNAMHILEDELFAIYYKEASQDRAEECLRYAHESIPRLAEICGKYYYPDEMHGRKVPIYLAHNQREYDEFLEKEFKIQNRGETSGLCYFHISLNGFYLDAIFLNGRYVFDSHTYFKEVLCHEMTHYCFFASVNYYQYAKIPMWCYEGIAEYTAMPGKRPKFTKMEIAQMRKQCDLTDDYFPYTYQNYTGGQSIFTFIEERYQLQGVQHFVNDLYDEGVPASLKKNFSLSIKQFENQWKEALDTF